MLQLKEATLPKDDVLFDVLDGDREINMLIQDKILEVDRVIYRFTTKGKTMLLRGLRSVAKKRGGQRGKTKTQKTKKNR